MHRQSQSVCLMPVCSLKGKVFHVFFFFAFVQTRWDRGAQKLESPLENTNRSRKVTRAEGAGIKCLHSEPRTCSWAFNFIFFFLCKDNVYDIFFPTKKFLQHSFARNVAMLEKDISSNWYMCLCQSCLI